MKPNISIRPLNDEVEARTIAGWFHEFWNHVPPYSSTEQEFEVLKKSIQGKITKLPFSLVYYSNEDPVGIICVSREESFTGRSDLTPWVTALFVTKKMRGSGIASVLIDEAHKTAKLLGFKQIHVTTREVAKLYQKNGYELVGSGQKDDAKYDILKKDIF